MFTGPDGVEYRWALGAMGMSYPKVRQFPVSPVSSMLNVEPRHKVGHR